MDRSGAVLDPGGAAISTAGINESSPHLAFDGVNYLVAWTERRPWQHTDVYAARVTRAGQLLDPHGVGIARSGQSETLTAALRGPLRGRVVVGYGRFDPDRKVERAFVRFVHLRPRVLSPK